MTALRSHSVVRGAAGLAVALTVCAVAATGARAESLKFKPLPPIYEDSKGGALKEPEGIASNGDLLVVADSGNARLLVYDVTAEQLTPRAEIKRDELPYPVRVQIVGKGEILAMDGKSRRIARIDAAGEFKGFIEITGATGSVALRSFRADREGNLTLVDVASARILFAGPDGKVTGEVPFPDGYRFISDLALGSRGAVFLLDSVGRAVYVIAKDAKTAAPLLTIPEDIVDYPSGLAADGNGRLYIIDEHGGGILVASESGTLQGRQIQYGWKEGQLRYPRAMCFDGRGNAFIADRANSRVQVYTLLP